MLNFDKKESDQNSDHFQEQIYELDNISNAYLAL